MEGTLFAMRDKEGGRGMVKNILITGGAGYIGSHTAEILIQNNKKVSLESTVWDMKICKKFCKMRLRRPKWPIGRPFLSCAAWYGNSALYH